MKRPDFQEKTEVKVISHDFAEYVRVNGVETKTDMYGWRGTVTAITGLDELGCMVPKPYSPDNYPVKWWVDVSFKSPTDERVYLATFDNWEVQLQPVQHKFVDIFSNKPGHRSERITSFKV